MPSVGRRLGTSRDTAAAGAETETSIDDTAIGISQADRTERRTIDLRNQARPGAMCTRPSAARPKTAPHTLRSMTPPEGSPLLLNRTNELHPHVHLSASRAGLRESPDGDGVDRPSLSPAQHGLPASCRPWTTPSRRGGSGHRSGPAAVKQRRPWHPRTPQPAPVPRTASRRTEPRRRLRRRHQRTAAAGEHRPCPLVRAYCWIPLSLGTCPGGGVVDGARGRVLDDGFTGTTGA